MVTSARDGEGKTTLASYLANSIAKTGKRVLLADCDLRRPALHRLFQAEGAPGMAEALLGEADVAEVIRPTPVAGLDLLAAGTPSEGALRALATDAVTRVFARLKADYDYIVVDSCPVLPVVDALLVAVNADAVVLSVRPFHSQLSWVDSTCERLAALGVPLAGVVVNGERGGQQSYGTSYLNKLEWHAPAGQS
jgi:capsular exopolysaccharide synthesis family protein